MKFNAVLVLTSLLGSAIAAPTAPVRHSRDVSVSADSPFAASLAARELLSLSERDEAAAAAEAADKDKILHLNLGGDGKLLSLLIKGLLNVNINKRAPTIPGFMGKTAVIAEEDEERTARRGLPDDLFETVGTANNGGSLGGLLDGLFRMLGLGGNILSSITKQLSGDQGNIGGLLNKLLGNGKPAVLDFTSQLKNAVATGTVAEDDAVQAIKNVINMAYDAAPDANTRQSIESVVGQAMMANANA